MFHHVRHIQNPLTLETSAGVIAIKRAVNMVGMDPVASFSYFCKLASLYFNHCRSLICGNVDGRCIQCVYNLAEPCVTIVAQTIPNLRVLVVRDKSPHSFPHAGSLPVAFRKGSGTRGVSGESRWPAFHHERDSAKDLRNFAIENDIPNV